MRSACLAFAALTLVVPGVAGAYEATFGMRAGVGYESNIFRSGTDVPDMVYLLAPTLKLDHRTGRFDGSLQYLPVAELFQEQSDANGMDQVVSLRLDYQLSPRTELSASDNFGFVRNIGRLQSDDGPSEVEITESRSLQNRASMSLRHSLTRRTSLGLAMSHDLRSSDRDNDRPRTAMGGSGTVSYVLTDRDLAGLGLSYSYTTIADGNTDDVLLSAQRSHSVNAFLTWARTWNAAWRSSLRVGPAFVTSTRTLTVPILRVVGISPLGFINRLTGFVPERIDSDNLTYFANASLTRSWDRGDATLNYQRSLSALSTTGVDSTVDAVFLTLSWNPNRDWTLTGRAGWNLRESVAASQAGGTVAALATKIKQYTGAASVRRRLTSRLSSSLAFNYLKQDAAGFSGASSFDNFQVNLGFRYEFAPVRP